MHAFNPKQTTAVAVAAAICATLLVIHNPTDGYDFTERHFGGDSRFKEEWQYSREGCTKELQVEMINIKQRIYESNLSSMEKAAATMTGRPAQIFRQCVEVTTWNDPIETEAEPMWVWYSRGALHPMLASVKNVLVAFSLVGLWAGVVVFAFRGKAKT